VFYICKFCGETGEEKRREVNRERERESMNEVEGLM
jgi:hypothetical protein